MSIRTEIRDGLANALTALQRSQAARIKDFTVSLTYDLIEECTKFPTYCVVVTDEALTTQSMSQVDCTATVLTVLYVQDAKDPRAKLDLAIEDVYDAVRQWGQGQRNTVWNLTLDSIETDEGTRIAKPHAQAVLRWSLHHRRAR